MPVAVDVPAWALEGSCSSLREKSIRWPWEAFSWRACRSFLAASLSLDCSPVASGGGGSGMMTGIA